MICSRDWPSLIWLFQDFCSTSIALVVALLIVGVHRTHHPNRYFLIEHHFDGYWSGERSYRMV